MARRLGEIEARIASVQQLSMVVSAMRGIAAARSNEARASLPAIRVYAATVARAIAQALALVPSTASTAGQAGTGRMLVIAMGSEQGFVGAYNTRILDAVAAQSQVRPDDIELVVIGCRASALAHERGIPVARTVPMAAHGAEATRLANRLADMLFDRIDKARVTEVRILHTAPSEIAGSPDVAVRSLIPFDFSRFPPASREQPPIIQVAPAQLLSALAAEYVFAELCEAVTLSFAAENEARMAAMIAASQSVATRHDELVAERRRVRQDQITEEVVELVSGTLARR